MYDRIKAVSDAIGDAASSVKNKSQRVTGAVATQAEDVYNSVKNTLRGKFRSSTATDEKIFPPSTHSEDEIEEAARRAVPVIWMLGKTGAGKTSIIAALTGSPHGKVGTGYKPCTTNVQLFDFPDETPLLRFLDTRGLGEAGYNHVEDVTACRKQAHMIIVVMRVADQSQECILNVLATIRMEQPELPILVVQTCLHEHYSPIGSNHPPVYPFDGTDADLTRAEISPKLRNTLAHQRKLFAKLKGKPPVFVAADFTQPGDGLDPEDYGREALINGLLKVAPEAVRLLIQLEFQAMDKSSTEHREKQAKRHILYWATAAAAVGAAPMVGVLTVPAAQAAMLTHLAKDYGVDWTIKDATTLVSLLGLAVVANQGMLLVLRQVAKIGVAMIPIAAAQDYALTYALGCAARVYLKARTDRTEVKAENVKQAFYSGLQAAFKTNKGQK